MKKILFLISALLLACVPGSSGWLQVFYNNTDAFIYILINQRQENGLIYPYYGELPTILDVDESPSLQGSAWAPGAIYYTLPYKETKIKRGDCIHVYAFQEDTLKQYSWEEIRAGKKYWFRETVCQGADIQFPDGFEYMGNIDE